MLRRACLFLALASVLCAESAPPVEEILRVPEPGRFQELFRPFRTDNEGATPILAMTQQKRSPARINWLGWTAPNRVRQAMNHYVIALGTYVAPLGVHAIATARKPGQVEVDVGDTDCRIPDAEAYIMKSRRGAPIAPKRETVHC